MFDSLCYHCFCQGIHKENAKEVFLQVPTRPEVLGIIQHYHDVTHTGIRNTIHAIRSKYNWIGLYQDVEEYVS